MTYFTDKELRQIRQDTERYEQEAHQKMGVGDYTVSSMRARYRAKYGKELPSTNPGRFADNDLPF